MRIAFVTLFGILVASVAVAGRGFLDLTQLGVESAQQATADKSSEIVARYSADSQRLIEEALSDSSAYERLAYLADTFGPRFSGSENLERAIDWILSEMAADGLENVHAEPVMVPKWVRGEESLQLLEPRKTEMHMMSLGGSVGTGPDGIEADVLVVGSFDELTARASEAAGRIVLFNVPFTDYSATVRYRVDGASAAAAVGAVASLVRSVGPVSLYTPHTGMLSYKKEIPRTPHAAVTIEDAAMMQRMQDRGQKVRVRLTMEARDEGLVPSRNVVAELVGSESPQEVVILGGHIDSWDVGQGAVDDAGGCLAAWHALVLMKRLGLRPRRTVRVVLWTNEENGLGGAKAYRDAHRDEIDDMVLAMESDSGVFEPLGFSFSGSPEARKIVSEVARLLDPIGAGMISGNGGGADIGPLMELGVPGMGLVVDGSKYFWYHHTHADTVDKVDPREMHQCAAAMAIMAYVVADMPQRLPRETASY
ncbi:MAG: M20/M25/M40 family metallo-hydrolase [Rhodothermia bacterium]|nr:M20/M25/M40 family metallo-hydrolase [Rhodothermia bacterium]